MYAPLREECWMIDIIAYAISELTHINNNNYNYITFISVKIQAQRHNKQIIWRTHKRGQAKIVIGVWNRRSLMVE